MDLVRVFLACFSEMERQLTLEELQEILSCPYAELSSMHFGLGRWIRNSFLTENSSLLTLFTATGFVHRDDISHFLTRLFFFYLRAKEENSSK